ncbi:hypothetical protein LVJ94_09205 [Pendulispora rubella]|uniref:Uncharacterized protein n=1 Tax=Pendulispora rubella TaxID=2741070 RepID=A0ABZ2LE15_9BACT
MQLRVGGLAAIALFWAVLFFSPPSGAQVDPIPKAGPGARAAAQQVKVEQQARSLQKKAIEDDYLSTEFAKAEERLTKAVTLCGSDKCSAQLRAQLRRDLGVVEIGGQIDREKGISNFVEALRIDPNVVLDPDLRTKELDQAFDVARRRAGLAGAGGGAVATQTAPANDFVHAPVAEQAVLTPVPIYVEYTGTEPLARVIVRYKGAAMDEWKALDLKRAGRVWKGLTPCGDVAQGTFQYYLQGFNAQNEPVATAGDRTNAYKVPIKPALEGAAPHLPGEAPPEACTDAADCPPGFPCEKKTEAPGPAPEAARKYPRFWVGAGLGFDFLVLPAGDDVCKLNGEPENGEPAKGNKFEPQNDAGYYCITPEGTEYPSRTDKFVENGKLQLGKAGKVESGLAPSNFRVWLSFDYALSANFLVGARIGLVFRTFPGSEPKQDGHVLLAPFHGEARLTYLVGKDAILQPVAPYGFVATGVSQYDAKVEVPVVELNVPGTRTIHAWEIGGPWFASLGAGVRVAFGDRKNIALLLGGRGNLTLPVAKSPVVPSFGPEANFQIGF